MDHLSAGELGWPNGFGLPAPATLRGLSSPLRRPHGDGER
jgi:hypothetical protein